MENKLLQLKNNANSVRDFEDSVRQGIPLAVFGVTDAFKKYLVSVIDKPVLYVVNDVVSANKSAQAIKEFSGKKVVVLPPKDELLLPKRAFSRDSTYARITAISEIQSADVVVATAESLMQTLPSSIESIVFKKNEEVVLSEAVGRLTQLGYVRVESVEGKGSFALRGDILDIFPVNSDNPIRIDFFGDVIEDIKILEVETRKNIGFISEFKVLQAVETLFSKKDLDNLFERTHKDILSASREASDNMRNIESDLLISADNKDFSYLSSYSSISENSVTFDKVINKDSVVIFDEAKRVYDTAVLLDTEFTSRFNALFKAGEVFSFSKNQFLTIEEFKNRLFPFAQATLQSLSTSNGFFSPLNIINPEVGGIANYRLDIRELITDVFAWLRTGYTITIFAGSQSRADKIYNDLYSNGIKNSLKNGDIFISSDKLAEGFIFHEEKIVVIGDGNLFAKPVSARRLKSQKANFFTAPETGDYCVHEVHGIGRVLGSKRISSTEGTKDYVSVEYHGGDLLYIPVEQMDILTRYLGGEKHPKLSKIGGKDFEKVKNRVRESIKKMSFDLKRLYEERQSITGIKYQKDVELQELFNSSFECEDTKDQEIATEEILSDMTSGKVMDRLLCGDVGFGKTEMAFRAVFLAVTNGKQVAMLAPTTILTEQHYNTALKRFKDFGIRIACLNRFRSAKEQSQILQAVKRGEIDLIIGTHRLISKDVEFKDLGLLVLDEEQKFGVEHKEKIKLLSKNVDTLTLSATPIPRTLHMSLSGIRSISTLNTPPGKRLPVQTYVTEETDTLIKDAITREVNRGGQVFLLYNRVETIDNFATRIKSILPELRITVVHGQMVERMMEKNILEFYRGESDLLISTTIIENGIDLPKANTLIVIDADRLGLSTLYQLKGRVGRSDRLAYAYFTFKKEKILSQTAYERLNAIIEFTEMGSGIKIAMRDLEIRGAGNVLGSEQHGNMDKIGYELYSKLLREELSGKEELGTELDIRVTAYIPEEYIEGNSARMSAYKEIAEVNSLTAETEVRDRLSDEYGELPMEVDNLINIAVAKHLASSIGISGITVRKSDTRLSFESVEILKNSNFRNALESFGKEVYVSIIDIPSVCFVRGNNSNDEMLLKVKEFLKKVTN